MSQTLLDEVSTLIGLQSALLSAFFAQFPGLRESRWLIGSASTGRVATQGGNWLFAKHGAGIRFTRHEHPQLVVDIHTRLDTPNLVDSWRLQQFLESKGRTIDLTKLRGELEKLVVAGHVMKEGVDQYSLDEAGASQKG